MLIFYHNVPTIQLSSAALSPSCSPRHDQSHHTILRASHFASVFSYNTTSFNSHQRHIRLRVLTSTHDQSHQRPSFANVLTLRVFITTHDQSHQRPTFANVLTSTRLISSATQIRLRVLTTTRSITRATNFRLLAHAHQITKSFTSSSMSERRRRCSGEQFQGPPSDLFNLSSSPPSRFRRRGELHMAQSAMCCEHLLR